MGRINERRGRDEWFGWSLPQAGKWQRRRKASPLKLLTIIKKGGLDVQGFKFPNLLFVN